MAAQVLVMCESCRRPQFASSQGCIACGAPLPIAALPSTQSARDRLLESHQPFLEGDFGQGRVLLLSERHLQWRSPREKESARFELPAIKRLELRWRPVWESLLIPLVASVVWLTHLLWLELAWVLLLILSLAACLFQRRYSLGVTLKTGDRREIFLSLGRRNSPPIQRTWSIWESLIPELTRLSVDARPR